MTEKAAGVTVQMTGADRIEADELAEGEIDIRHLAHVQPVTEPPESHDLGWREGELSGRREGSPVGTLNLDKRC